MIWKIEKIEFIQNLPQEVFNVINPTSTPLNMETSAEVTIRFRYYNGESSLEAFENEMKTTTINGRDFTPEQVEKAIKHFYPEYFI